MPWRETWVMDEKVRFVAAASEEEAVMSELCVEFGISRQTGYKWLQRYRAEGLEGLKDRSRAPTAMAERARRSWWRRLWACASASPRGVPRSFAASFPSAGLIFRRRRSARSATGCARRGSRNRAGRGGAVRPLLRHSRRSSSPMRCGAPTSRAGFAPARVSAAIP